MTSPKINIALFASGNGSNALNILKTYEQKLTSFDHLNFTLLFSDNASAAVLSKVKDYPIKTQVIEAKTKSNIKDTQYNAKLLDLVKKEKIDWVFLAGYMRILDPSFIDHFKDEEGYSRIINIHPSLLPSFKGLNAYEKAFDLGVKVSGATIHFVDEKIDHGHIISQRSFSRLDNDSLSDFKKRGLSIEHELYSEFLHDFCKKKIIYKNNLVTWKANESL